jgi:hypothetical protein
LELKFGRPGILAKSSTSEQFVAALTDFGPGRSKLFGNGAPNTSGARQRPR